MLSLQKVPAFVMHAWVPLSELEVVGAGVAVPEVKKVQPSGDTLGDALGEAV